MKKTIFIMAALAAISTLYPLLGAAAELTPNQIAEKAYHIEDGDDLKSVAVMVVTRKNGDEKTRHFSFVRKDYGEDNRSLIVFTSPADVKGTSFLTWTHVKGDNDQWLYLPALKTTKRIGTSNKSDSFMGSDFSYEDMSKRATDKDTFKLLGNEMAGGADCYILEAMAKDRNEKFVKRVCWIRKDNFITVRTDFYDAAGTLVKRYTGSDIKKISNIDTILTFKMEDLTKESHSVMTLSNVVYNTKPADRMFTAQNFK